MFDFPWAQIAAPLVNIFSHMAITLLLLLVMRFFSARFVESLFGHCNTLEV